MEEMYPINIIAKGKVKRFFRAKRKLIHPHIEFVADGGNIYRAIAMQC